MNIQPYQIEELKAGLRAELAKWEKIPRLKWEEQREMPYEFFRLHQASRTITPRLLQMWIDEVEWLEEKLSYAPYTDKDSCEYYEAGYNMMQATLSDDCNERLATIYAAWKGVL